MVDFNANIGTNVLFQIFKFHEPPKLTLAPQYERVEPHYQAACAADTFWHADEEESTYDILEIQKATSRGVLVGK